MGDHDVMIPQWQKIKKRMNDDQEPGVECLLRLVTWSLRGGKRTKEDGGRVKKFMIAVN